MTQDPAALGVRGQGACHAITVSHGYTRVSRCWKKLWGSCNRAYAQLPSAQNYPTAAAAAIDTGASLGARGLKTSKTSGAGQQAF